MKVKTYGCTEEQPCLKPMLRWVHSGACRRKAPRGLMSEDRRRELEEEHEEFQK